MAKVKAESVQSFKPLFAVSSDDEPIPPSQADDLRCALLSKNINTDLYQILVLLKSQSHAFNTWLRPDGQGQTVRQDVIAFLDDHFKNPP